MPTFSTFGIPISMNPSQRMNLQALGNRIYDATIANHHIHYGDVYEVKESATEFQLTPESITNGYVFNSNSIKNESMSVGTEIFSKHYEKVRQQLVSDTDNFSHHSALDTATSSARTSPISSAEIWWEAFINGASIPMLESCIPLGLTISKLIEQLCDYKVNHARAILLIRSCYFGLHIYPAVGKHSDSSSSGCNPNSSRLRKIALFDDVHLVTEQVIIYISNSWRKAFSLDGTETNLMPGPIQISQFSDKWTYLTTLIDLCLAENLLHESKFSEFVVDMLSSLCSYALPFGASNLSTDTDLLPSIKGISPSTTSWLIRCCLTGDLLSICLNYVNTSRFLAYRAIYNVSNLLKKFKTSKMISNVVPDLSSSLQSLLEVLERSHSDALEWMSPSVSLDAVDERDQSNEINPNFGAVPSALILSFPVYSSAFFFYDALQAFSWTGASREPLIDYLHSSISLSISSDSSIPSRASYLHIHALLRWTIQDLGYCNPYRVFVTVELLNELNLRFNSSVSSPTSVSILPPSTKSKRILYSVSPALYGDITSPNLGLQSYLNDAIISFLSEASVFGKTATFTELHRLSNLLCNLTFRQLFSAEGLINYLLLNSTPASTLSTNPQSAHTITCFKMLLFNLPHLDESSIKITLTRQLVLHGSSSVASDLEKRMNLIATYEILKFLPFTLFSALLELKNKTTNQLKKSKSLPPSFFDSISTFSSFPALNSLNSSSTADSTFALLLSIPAHLSAGILSTVIDKFLESLSFMTRQFLTSNLERGSKYRHEAEGVTRRLILLLELCQHHFTLRLFVLSMLRISVDLDLRVEEVLFRCINRHFSLFCGPHSDIKPTFISVMRKLPDMHSADCYLTSAHLPSSLSGNIRTEVVARWSSRSFISGTQTLQTVDDGTSRTLISSLMSDNIDISAASAAMNSWNFSVSHSMLVFSKEVIRQLLLVALTPISILECSPSLDTCRNYENAIYTHATSLCHLVRLACRQSMYSKVSGVDIFLKILVGTIASLERGRRHGDSTLDATQSAILGVASEFDIENEYIIYEETLSESQFWKSFPAHSSVSPSFIVKSQMLRILFVFCMLGINRNCFRPIDMLNRTISTFSFEHSPEDILIFSRLLSFLLGRSCALNFDRIVLPKLEYLCLTHAVSSLSCNEISECITPLFDFLISENSSQLQSSPCLIAKSPSLSTIAGVIPINYHSSVSLALFSLLTNSTIIQIAYRNLHSFYPRLQKIGASANIIFETMEFHRRICEAEANDGNVDFRLHDLFPPSNGDIASASEKDILRWGLGPEHHKLYLLFNGSIASILSHSPSLNSLFYKASPPATSLLSSYQYFWMHLLLLTDSSSRQFSDEIASSCALIFDQLQPNHVVNQANNDLYDLVIPFKTSNLCQFYPPPSSHLTIAFNCYLMCNLSLHSQKSSKIIYTHLQEAFASYLQKITEVISTSTDVSFLRCIESFPGTAIDGSVISSEHPLLAIVGYYLLFSPVVEYNSHLLFLRSLISQLSSIASSLSLLGTSIIDPAHLHVIREALLVRVQCAGWILLYGENILSKSQNELERLLEILVTMLTCPILQLDDVINSWTLELDFHGADEVLNELLVEDKLSGIFDFTNLQNSSQNSVPSSFILSNLLIHLFKSLIDILPWKGSLTSNSSTSHQSQLASRMEKLNSSEMIFSSISAMINSRCSLMTISKERRELLLRCVPASLCEHEIVVEPPRYMNDTRLASSSTSDIFIKEPAREMSRPLVKTTVWEMSKPVVKPMGILNG